MLKKALFLLSLMCGVLLLTSFTFQKLPVQKTIIIDAGHGGKDQGAAGLTSTEAQICLQLSMKIGQQIEREIPGVKVLYTRTSDIIPGNLPTKDEGLRYRANFANQSGADLFISIHCNSAGRSPGGWNERRVVDHEERITYVGKGKKKRKVVKRIPIYETFYVTNETRGTETYIWTAKENTHKGQMVGVGEVGGEADSTIDVPEDDPTIKALQLIYAKKYFAKSLHLAELIQQEFERSGRVNRGVKQRNEKGIWVLHATGMPSILVETGFISNKEEEEFMLTEQGQTEMSGNITAAVKNYFANVPQPASTTTGYLPKENSNTVLTLLHSIAAHEEHKD
jgi:N-acetylmuramoyl-L-alanine amidase